MSVIIPAAYSLNHLQRQIAVSQRLEPLEIILVVSSRLIPQLPPAAASHCQVIPVDGPASLFAGRALGAAQARGDILLFLGEDRYYPNAGLQRFLFPLRYGQVDVMLSREAARGRVAQCPKPVHSLSLLFNELYGRMDLLEASLIDTPHAMTRAALRRLGAERLAHPADAHRELVKSGVSLRAMPLAPDRDIMPFQPQLAGTWLSELSVWEQAVIAEHAAVCARLPWRGGLGDGGRRRDLADRSVSKENELLQATGEERLQWKTGLCGGQGLSVIIPACNEAATIGAVIREVRQLAPAEIIVVVNGSHDKTAQIARQHAVATVELPQALGVDTGRAVGASLAGGEWLLFVDADFVIPAMELYPFVRACRLGADLALNDQSRFLAGNTANAVTAARQALNVAANRKELRYGSMLAVPFALRRESFAPLGWSLLACPPKAQAAAALAGLDIRQVHEVDSFARNRLRPEKNLAPLGRTPAVEQLLGDHIEALQLLAERGGIKRER